MKFIHTILLTVLTVSFMVSVTATPVLVHACKGILERVCDNDCCGSQHDCCGNNDCCSNQAKDSCCDEIVSVTSLDCDMVKDAYASIPSPGTTFTAALATASVISGAFPKERADEWTLRTGPDPTCSRLCVFLI